MSRMKLPNPFRSPSACELALVELEDAERQLLAAHTGKEFADSQITYNTQRVSRLRRYLNGLSELASIKEAQVLK